MKLTRLLAFFIATFILPLANAELFLSMEEKYVVNSLLAMAGQSEELQSKKIERLEKVIAQALNSETKVVEVKNFPEFIKSFRGQWPVGIDVAQSLELVERDFVLQKRTYRSSSPRVQRQIDRYLQQHFEGMRSYLSPEVFAIVRGDGASKFQLRTAANKVYAEALNRLDGVGTKVVASGLLKVDNKGMQAFLETTFDNYFSRQPEEIKKRIFSSILEGDVESNELAFFKSMILNSGPQFQKLLQIVSREAGLSPEMQSVFKILESSASPVPPQVVKDIFESERKNYDWQGYESRPLGVGTMAQVHRAKMRLADGTKKSVIVRFLKPGIEARVRADQVILEAIAPLIDAHPDYRAAGYPKLSSIVDDLTNTVLAELDIQKTIENQTQGKQAYTSKSAIRFGSYKNFVSVMVPGIYRTNPESKLMVQEMAFGKKLDKAAVEFADVIPEMKVKVAEHLAAIWLEEVLFKSGFFHSDLHQGNFLVNVRDESIDISILDFGMTGKINQETRYLGMVLGAAIEMQHADSIVETYWNLSLKSQNLISKQVFGDRVRMRLQKIRASNDPVPTLDMWTAWTIDQGLKFSEVFIGLNRGLVIIESMLKEAGSKHDITYFAKFAALKHPLQVNAAFKNDKYIHIKDLLHLGWIKITESTPILEFLTPKPRPIEGLSCQGIFRSPI
jgi:ubiquinone biosynthesis protein